MNSTANKSPLPKVCSICPVQQTCAQSTAMRRQCYQRWYNRTQRDPHAERLRQALFRQRNFEKWMLSRCKAQAKKINLPFDLDLDWFKAEMAKGVCSVSGIPFVLPRYQPGARGKRGPWTPSVDRIDNTKGYVKGNARLVIWIYNLAKSDYPEADVTQLCLAVAMKQLIPKVPYSSARKVTRDAVPQKAVRAGAESRSRSYYSNVLTNVGGQVP